MGRVSGRVALITGGASGIGRGAALALSREGAAVVICDIDEDQGKSCCSEVLASGGHAAFQRLDVTSEDAWRDAVSFVQQRYGALHVLVNSAGISAVALLADLSLERWRRTLSINLDGVYLGCRAAIPLMERSGGGSIINISSTAGAMGLVGMSHYCASKAAVRYFSKSVALECAAARNEIRVNCILPGGIETPIWSKMGNDGFPLPPGSNLMAEAMALGQRRTAEVTPMGRAGTVSEIAAAIVYLASDETRFMTGADIVIDGGATAGRNFLPADERT